MEEKKKRLANIDLLETLAIVFVVAYHLALNPADGFLTRSVGVKISYFTNTLLSTCVPIFFFANGYLLLNRPFDLKKHIRKMVTIFALILVWSLITQPIGLLVSGEPLTVKSVLYAVLDQRTTHFWYLSALLAIYALFPAFKSLFDSNQKAFLFVTCVCFVLTFGYNLANNGVAVVSAILHRPLPTLDYPLITRMNPFRTYGYAFVYFCVGGLAARHEDRILSIPAMKRNLSAAAALLIGCASLWGVGILYTNFVDNESWDVVWNGYDTVFTMLNVLALYVLTLNDTKDIALIRQISVNTLGVFFLHPLVLWLVKPFLKQFEFLKNAPCNLLLAVLVTLFCTAVCMLLRRIPVVRKLVST